MCESVCESVCVAGVPFWQSLEAKGGEEQGTMNGGGVGDPSAGRGWGGGEAPRGRRGLDEEEEDYFKEGR